MYDCVDFSLYTPLVSDSLLMTVLVGTKTQQSRFWKSCDFFANFR